MLNVRYVIFCVCRFVRLFICSKHFVVHLNVTLLGLPVTFFSLNISSDEWRLLFRRWSSNPLSSDSQL